MSEGNPVVCGGAYQNQSEEAPQNCFWYDAGNNAWSGKADLLVPRSDYALGQLNNDDFWVLGEC